MKTVEYTLSEIEDIITEHIFRGDSGDGVPNVLSEDNCFVEGIRQKSLRKEKISDIISMGDKADPDILRRIERNKMLVDLSKIPTDVEQEIMDAFKQADENKVFGTYKYVISKKLGVFLSDIGYI